ncbi:MAG TPA: adenylosuccinate lyase [Methanobacteriales archaeon]|nr:MAG: Adenylosuccinate lyase [Methanobacteriaceae archaeon 41_258]MBC7089565.1 adenylosuccinate lyase [Methanobacteriaceae archaeon]MBC7096889.1 adenylosuccinate lyase [Methanobacteriales archaeon]MDI3484377.1 adenylosuccinate lyase [Methanobacteriaceae archaeon]HIH62609.1 adenylosuccinate lyase [Methanobacteriales archaeon]
MAIHPIEFRYGTPEMKRVWDAENKLQKMLDVEAAIAEAEASLGIIPEYAAEEIKRKANTKYVKLERVNQIEKETKHDIAALIKALAEQCEGDAGEYIHFGATSNDIIDTTNSLLFKESIKILKEKIIRLIKLFLKLADENKKRVCIGRTHGQHALPTTYGMKFALWADEMHRNLERLKSAEKRLCLGMVTGAVGTTAALGEEGLKVHLKVSRLLGLEPALISNQVIQRDNHAEFIMVLANIVTTLDKIALEIRNLQRTEIMEVGEKFDPEKQVGSSTMPHKMNPITAERICGLARVIRSHVITALENNLLWHERDLTNSSPERIIFPESCILTDYLLHLTTNLIENLVFFDENIEKNLKLTNGLIMAERLMAELAKRGMGRQTAYRLVRECAIKANQERVPFIKVVGEKKEIREYLSREELENIMDPYTYIGSAIKIVENVLKKSREWF